MDWVIVSNKTSNQDFAKLRRRLMFAYLVVMTSIVGVSATLLYIFFERSMRQQLDHELITLAQAATPSFKIIKEQGEESLDQELAWQELFSRKKQSLQWFKVNGQTFAQVGEFFPKAPFPQKLLTSSDSRNSFLFQDEYNIRSVTIAVYVNEPEKNTLKLKGYIRASESNRELNSTLNQLRLGLWFGGATAMFLIAISSVYLTQLAFEPTLKNFQQLKQFAADASHELGTPLTKISFATEILLSYPEQIQRPSGQKKLQIINRATEQMKYLLSDLLFLARTDATETISYSKKSDVRIDLLLQQVAESLMAAARTKEIDFQIALDCPLVVKGNGAELNRLFSNLLGNAFKYTESGGKVTFSLEQSQRNAVIAVKDTGIGIAPEHLSCVFQRFWRDERVRKQKKEGSGLGLAIAKTIVQKHQGKITVESQIGLGSCFLVYLPLVKLIRF
jgi:two-component system, OmpR family, manganese sensing sensor histidine kinase